MHRLCTLWLSPLVVILTSASLSGCAVWRDFQPSVVVETIAPEEYIARQRGDILTTGELSARTLQTIQVTGLDQEVCATLASPACLPALADARGISAERKLSTLAELWLQHAMSGAAPTSASSAFADDDLAAMGAWLEVARHAYAYLFFTPRSPGERAFEERQTQVRDWYNYAVQQAATQLFGAWDGSLAAPDSLNDGRSVVDLGGWTLQIEQRVRLPGGVDMPQELLPASSLVFQGLRSTYRRDGFGAELVAVMDSDPVGVSGDVAEASEHKRRRPPPPTWSEMPSPNMTMVLRFAGQTLEELLQTREVIVSVHDPLVEQELVLHDQRVPLAGNFTAGYGVWLARSGFNKQSLRSLFGRERGIERPHLYMMQPFDPDRRIILMLHGLASSPEAWVNVANEILGDEALRREFQVWQVYYPTNMPVAINHAAIRRLLSEALHHFDPGGQTAASNGLVLVGHSMGGMIARLMVSSSGQQLWEWALADREVDPERLERVRPRLDPMLRFEPFPGVEQAIFIAAPHRGTTVVDHRIVRWVAGFIRLPLTILEGLDELVFTPAHADDEADEVAIPTSIDNLNAQDPFVRAAANLPISERVCYHSIIARASAEGALEDSDDGLVPYRSAHLSGAASEKIIVSGHSVQETAASILEVRRILQRELDECRS